MRGFESAGAVQDRMTMIGRPIHGGDVVEDVAERKLQDGGEAVGTARRPAVGQRRHRKIREPSCLPRHRHINISVNAGRHARTEARRLNAQAPATDRASIAGIANRGGRTDSRPKTGSSISQA
jgi:hypothetical protein